jgi:signal transduction histidine kinase
VNTNQLFVCEAFVDQSMSDLLDRFGLIGMNERVKLLGGELKLETSPGKGTRVEVTVPV